MPGVVRVSIGIGIVVTGLLVRKAVAWVRI